MTTDLQSAIARFESALSAHDAEYARVLALWRLKKADIMELGCPAQNAEISNASGELEAIVLSAPCSIGNAELLAHSREMVERINVKQET